MPTLTLNKSVILQKRPDLAKLLAAKTPPPPVTKDNPPAAPAPPCEKPKSQNETLVEAPRQVEAPPPWHIHVPCDEATAVLNRQRHDEWRERLDACEAFLVSRCPPFADPSQPVPLAIGIHLTVCDRFGDQFPKDVLCSAVSRWCHREVYQAAIVRGGVRVDLDGAPCGEVSEQHRKWSRT